MQKFIKKARSFEVIDRYCWGNHDIINRYDEYFKDLLPLYEHLDPLGLPKDHPINILIDEIILDRIIAYYYRMSQKG